MEKSGESEGGAETTALNDGSTERDESAEGASEGAAGWVGSEDAQAEEDTLELPEGDGPEL